MKAFFSQHPGGTVTVHFSQEIPWVAFTSLDFSEGVESLVDQTRHVLKVEVAVGFEPAKIEIELADCVRRNCYPEQQIVMKQTPPRSKGEPADEIEGRWTT